jgi:hypothetical protein
MLGRGELVAVLVTYAAPEQLEALRQEKEGYLGRFERRRDRFERTASSKHRRGQVEVPGVVSVNPGDLG